MFLFSQNSPLIESIANLIQIQKNKIYKNNTLIALKDKDNCVSISNEEDNFRTLTKYIK